MFEEFIQHLRDEALSHKTITSYEVTWKRFDTWLQSSNGSGKEVNAVYATQKDVADFKRHLDNAGGKGGKPAAPSTKNLTFVHLNRIFRFFVNRGYILDNPVGPIKKPPRARRQPKWLARNEQNALHREVRLRGDVRENAIVLTFLRMGLRVHELCDLELTDLTMSDRKGTAYIRGKGDKDRVLPISSELRTALQAYLDTRNDNSPYVFVSRRSPKCTERGIQHMIEKYRNFTGIKHLSCHSLRHTFGHDLLEATKDLQKVANLMGHFKENGEPNIAMTMIYTTPGFEDLEAAVESISWT
ncbi:tyrosine-type recombinase/integrase [Paenibacillus hubeiensis]|uniref:tyrosine-type recombinase/integrase n=1 Tax=Paenibacillus hubeiensis TaxID=3077330 RepID=UPI0031BAE714